MLKVISEVYDIDDLLRICWADAIDVLKEIQKQDRESEFMTLIEDCFLDGATETTINDFIRFDVPDIMGLYE